MTDFPDTEADTVVDRDRAALRDTRPAPRSLPIVKAAKPATAFCGVEVLLWHGVSLFVDGNSKITRENGTYESPKPNAFSLPAASVPDPYAHASLPACPGSTSVCRESCYVKGLAKHNPELYFKYASNAEALARILANDGDFAESAVTLGYWIADHCKGGFRWHVSGDVLNVRHAEWIALVCSFAPNVPFWIYTRTLRALGTLAQVPNLAVNVSADRENFAAARFAASVYGARLCYLADKAEHDWRGFHENAPSHCAQCGQYEGGCTDEPARAACIPLLPPGSVIFPDYSLRGRDLEDPTSSPWWQSLTHAQRAMVCGTDFFGQSEAHRCGPCGKCF